MFVVLTLLAIVIAFAGTLAVERRAVALKLVSVPNARSSHVGNIPRGGGAAIAVAIVLCGALALLTDTGIGPAALVLIALAALLGFADDLFDLPWFVRAPIQLLFFAFAATLIADLPPLDLGIVVIDGVGLAALMALAGFWWLNLFNFMDGIDGMAGSHAVAFLFGALAAAWVTGIQGFAAPWQVLALVAIGASAGFLVRNWPPAKIFMGDAGSYGLAMTIFIVALQSIGAGTLTYQSWLILPALFVADTGVTIVNRLWRRERIWQAHRQHAYQALSRRWGHRNATLFYLGVTLIWCLPLAGLGRALIPNLAWVHRCILAYLPLIMAWSSAPRRATPARNCEATPFPVAAAVCGLRRYCRKPC